VIGAVCLLVLSGVLSAQGNSDNAFERVKEVQERHTEAMMARQGVVGTGVGLNDQGRHAVVVLLESPGVGGIPQELEGVPVHPVVTGKIYALPKGGKPGGGTPAPSPTSKWRPVPIGVSTGNIGECSAGTIGCKLVGGYALSNNHVYALENNAETGSQIVQPGRYDVSCATNPSDVIGTLSYFVPINFGGTNTVDAAMAACDDALLLNSTPSGGYGTPKSETTEPVLGVAVQKYGRTTALTKGQIAGVSFTVRVGYSGGTATFTNQIMVTSRKAFIKAGDSGSLLVTDPGKKPVGLLFAGDQSGRYAWANDIHDVLAGLGGMSIDGE